MAASGQNVLRDVGENRVKFARAGVTSFLDGFGCAIRQNDGKAKALPYMP